MAEAVVGAVTAVAVAVAVVAEPQQTLRQLFLAERTMTNDTLFRHASILLVAIALTACGGGDTDNASQGGGPAATVDANGASSFDSTALGIALKALPQEALSPQESESLLYMREEEKLAGDVYTLMDALWGGNVRVFGNIATSEAHHTEAVRQLLMRYSLPDPAASRAPGVFQNPALQALYTRLVAQGSASLTEALRVGVTIEELDMLDINTHLASVDNQDIRRVYEELLKGSRNHLRSYHKTLLKQGESYTPQYLSQAEFDAIVNSEMERG